MFGLLLCRSLSESYYAEATLLKEKKDKEIMIQTAAVQQTSDIIKDVVDQEVLNLATAEIRSVLSIHMCGLHVSPKRSHNGN